MRSKRYYNKNHYHNSIPLIRSYAILLILFCYQRKTNGFSLYVLYMNATNKTNNLKYIYLKTKELYYYFICFNFLYGMDFIVFYFFYRTPVPNYYDPSLSMKIRHLRSAGLDKQRSKIIHLHCNYFK